MTVVDKNSPASLVQLAAALTSAKRAPEALRMLKAIQKKPVRSLALKAALYLELGRAHLNVGEAKNAASDFFLRFHFLANWWPKFNGTTSSRSGIAHPGVLSTR